MNSTQLQKAKSYFRADYILLGTTIVMCVLVSLILLTLARESALNTETLRTVQNSRAVRDASLALNQSVADAAAARRAILIAGDRRAIAPYEDASRNIREQVDRLASINATDPGVAAASVRLRALTESYLAELAAVTVSDLRSARLEPTAATQRQIAIAADAVRVNYSALNDAARARQIEARRRIDLISIALAVVAFLAPVLAILAVRRERQLWRAANEIAEAAREQAMEADLEKSRFLAVASHDMRQPLHALSLYIGALERRVDTPDARDILTKMDRATQSLVGMFSKLLDLARVQAGAVKLELVAAPLQDIIDRVAAEHPESAVTFARSPAVVRTDPILLERLLGNLVGNALKHGGGKARIAVREHPQTVDITVADDGPGIAAEDQERVFGEFVRLGRKTDGLGLGLSIVRRIAELLEAPLKLESRPGSGARFTITVPRAQTSQIKPSAAGDSNTIAGQPILVVDDDQLALEAMRQALADLGADVRSSAREADAEQLLDAGFAPRLIVMDLRIDGEIAGIDIARRLRRRLVPPPPVIVVTGDTAPETLAVLQLSGFVWLIKPINPADIEEAARTLLSST